MGDMFNLGEKAAGTFFGWLGARKSQRQARQERENQKRYVDELDWEPEYAADHVPTYQKTQSPVARAYLESTLLGYNPDTTWEGETNAKYKRAMQERTKGNLFGTPEELAAESKRVQADNSAYKVAPFTRQVNPPDTTTTESGQFNASQLPVNQVATYLQQTKGLTDVAARNAEMQRLLKQYGTTDRIVDAIRAGKV